MQLTKSLEKLVNDAAAKGYTVKHDSTVVYLTKGKRGLAIWEDGTATRMDVSNATTIRTQKVMREVLGV